MESYKVARGGGRRLPKTFEEDPKVFWHSVALCGMNYGTYKRKLELFFDSCWKTGKRNLSVNHYPNAAG